MDITPEAVIAGTAAPEVAARVAAAELAAYLHGLYEALVAEGFTPDAATTITGAALTHLIEGA